MGSKKLTAHISSVVKCHIHSSKGKSTDKKSAFKCLLVAVERARQPGFFFDGLQWMS